MRAPVSTPLASEPMTPEEMKQLAKLLQNMPGLKVVELKDVTKLAALLRESPDIGSIEVKGLFGTGVVVTRTVTAAPTVIAAPLPAAAPALLPAASAAAAAEAPPAASPAASTLKDIRSPMVGTFYKSPEPGADPYVTVGSRVAPGQTVCIIEAMKIMNEIEAEVAGVIREVVANDTTPVEYGQVLFRVDPNG
jgi:acetyl-CoA carboxylase biotin carboxyl carrier protein